MPDQSLPPRSCPDCDGTGYAVNCGPADRERGDLWACGTCDGTGKVPDVLPPRPWTVVRDEKGRIGRRLIDADGVPIKGFWIYHPHDVPLLEAICLRVNSFEDLVEALHPLAAATPALECSTSRTLDGDGVFFWAQSGPNAKAITLNDGRRAQRALAKAEGGEDG